MLAAYDLSQPGSLTLSAPFCVMTSLTHCNRNTESCTDGYTTAIMHSNLKMAHHHANFTDKKECCTTFSAILVYSQL